MDRVQAFVPRSITAVERVSYSWNDWDPYADIASTEEKAVEEWNTVSDNALFVFTLGCAEWVMVRLGALLVERDARLYADACWATQVSDDYALPPPLRDQEWKGPVRGIVGLSLITVLNTRYGVDENSGALEAAFAEKIVSHVLEDVGVFVSWRNAVLERLKTLCPYDEQNPSGVRLPPEILDPTTPLQAEDIEAKCARWLDILGLDQNPFAKKRETD